MDIRRSTARLINSVRDGINLSKINDGKKLLGKTKMAPPLSEDLVCLSSKSQSEKKISTFFDKASMTKEEFEALIKETEQKLQEANERNRKLVSAYLGYYHP